MMGVRGIRRVTPNYMALGGAFQKTQSLRPLYMKPNMRRMQHPSCRMRSMVINHIPVLVTALQINIRIFCSMFNLQVHCGENCYWCVKVQKT